MTLLHIGSDSIHVSSYVDALNRTGLHQLLVAESKCGFKYIESELNVSFKSLKPGIILKNYGQLKQFINESKPDIVHIHQVNRLGFFAARAAKKAGIPILTTAWGSDVLLMPQQNILYRFLVKSVLKNSAIVTADSQDMIRAMEFLAKGKNKYYKLQYGIAPVEAVEKEKIIYSNRLLKPLYRIDEVLRYFADFSVNHNDWKLIVGGSGTEKDKLETLCEELNIKEKTTFIGFVDAETNRAIYAKAMIYISIPESDGTSVSLLEAMSAGCVPVVSDLAVSREWITDGRNGVIENGTDNPLEKALIPDREKVAVSNREIIEREATREASLKVFNQFYNRLLNGKQD